MLYRQIVKPLTDRLVAGTGLMVTLPFILLIAVAIGIRMVRPVVFRQVRIGRNDRPFTFLKLRTNDARIGTTRESVAGRNSG